MKFEYWFERVIDKLQRQYGRFAIDRLPLYIVGLNAFVYALNYLNPRYVSLLTLNMEKVFQGQIWRLFTYLFIPPMTNLLFIFFALYFLYMVGSALETEWGSFRLTLYYLIGMIATTFVAFCFPAAHISNVFLNTSLFLAFATIHPDFQVYLFFVIPVKMRYLAIITWVFIVINIAFGSLITKLVTLVSVVNYVLFFWTDIVQNVKTMYRGSESLPAFSRVSEHPFHRCQICQRTEKDDIELEFRTCAECGKEYCLEHFREHSAGGGSAFGGKG